MEGNFPLGMEEEMKNKWQGIRIAIVVAITTGWWGFWYPELMMMTDSYAIVMEDGTVQKPSEVIECGFDECFYEDMLKTEESNIKIRCRLWEYIKEYSKEDL